jgi:nucleotidyltransferase/DNA polymerase involved in DNA repair
MSTAIRWTIDVSEETDQAVREYLADSDQGSDDLSGLVEEAVRWRLLDTTVQRLKARNTDLPAVDLEAAIDAEVAAMRVASRRN